MQRYFRQDPLYADRFSDVRRGPDGCLHVLTDADDEAILRPEPVER